MVDLAPNWKEWTTDAGEKYYHNSVTNVTQWEKPTPPLQDLLSEGVFTYNPTSAELDALSKVSTTSGPNAQALGAPTGTDDAEKVSLTVSSGVTQASGSGSERSERSAAAVTGTSGDETAAQGTGVPTWLLGYVQNLFDVSTEDVVNRLRISLTPNTNPSEAAKQDIRLRPDFYGPFWVATTAVLFLSATGNFARLIESGGHEHFRADYGLVSFAATMIYGCLFAVPAVARTCLFFSGEEVETVDFQQMICVCGYSLTPAIPVSLLCIIPFGLVRWLAVFAGLAASLIFLWGHLLADFEISTPWLRWVMLVAPCVMPVMVFFSYRLHFFDSLP